MAFIEIHCAKLDGKHVFFIGRLLRGAMLLTIVVILFCVAGLEICGVCLGIILIDILRFKPDINGCTRLASSRIEKKCRLTVDGTTLNPVFIDKARHVRQP